MPHINHWNIKKNKHHSCKCKRKLVYTYNPSSSQNIKMKTTQNNQTHQTSQINMEIKKKNVFCCIC